MGWRGRGRRKKEEERVSVVRRPASKVPHKHAHTHTHHTPAHSHARTCTCTRTPARAASCVGSKHTGHPTRPFLPHPQHTTARLTRSTIHQGIQRYACARARAGYHATALQVMLASKTHLCFPASDSRPLSPKTPGRLGAPSEGTLLGALDLLRVLLQLAAVGLQPDGASGTQHMLAIGVGAACLAAFTGDSRGTCTQQQQHLLGRHRPTKNGASEDGGHKGACARAPVYLWRC